MAVSVDVTDTFPPASIPVTVFTVRVELRISAVASDNTRLLAKRKDAPIAFLFALSMVNVNWSVLALTFAAFETVAFSIVELDATTITAATASTTVSLRNACALTGDDPSAKSVPRIVSIPDKKPAPTSSTLYPIMFSAMEKAPDTTVPPPTDSAIASDSTFINALFTALTITD